jgi:phasin family protein
MSKPKTPEENAPPSAESEIERGAETAKSSLAAKGLENVVEFTKDNVAAYKKSKSAAGKGLETLNAEMQTYSKQLIEGSIEATRAIMESSSFYEAIELQTHFVKSALEAYANQLTKISELSTAMARDSLVPIQERVDAFVEAVQREH